MRHSTNHTFVVCAYKESPYLEECIRSLVAQTVRSNIEIYTSTPNEHIRNIGEKYHVPVYVNEEAGQGIQADWNYAYNHAKTDYVTVAHQDDVYEPEYVRAFLKCIKDYDDWSIYYTDYTPIKHGDSSKRDINSKIRRILRFPVKNRRKADKIWVIQSYVRLLHITRNDLVILCLHRNMGLISTGIPSTSWHASREGSYIWIWYWDITASMMAPPVRTL